GVTHTALGQLDLAERWLIRAQRFGEEHANPEWQCIACYDIGYLNVHISFDAGRAREAFRQSIAAYEHIGNPTKWRQIEVLQARAFLSLFEGDPHMAMSRVEEALYISKVASTLYYDIKLLNLLGCCNIMMGQFSQAKVAFEQGRSKAAISFNERGYWR